MDMFSVTVQLLLKLGANQLTICGKGFGALHKICSMNKVQAHQLTIGSMSVVIEALMSSGKAEGCVTYFFFFQGRTLIPTITKAILLFN